MCGIAAFSGRFDRTALEQATLAIAHRGPDASGTYLSADAQVGLGHTRLSIVDLSALGAQPMASDDGTVVLTYNGEIYNHYQLRADLEARGHRFHGHSDTETLLHLYLEFGEAMLPRLNGIFAFALWDARDNGLLVARDGLGVKPLYFATGARGVAVSSEIKALLQLVPEARELDIAALHRYLTFLWCPGDGTPLKGVKKLNPGEALMVRGGRIERRWRWYQLPAFRAEATAMSEGDAIAGTASHLREAVRRQMMADVPVGAFLSGGLDSSAIVAFAREDQPGLHCFTIEMVNGQDEGQTDDLPYARRVAEHLDVKLDVVRVDAADMAADFEYMIGQLDEPLADPAPLNVLHISRLARASGIKVLLSGAGGDDLFTGYRRHRAVGLDPVMQWLPAGIRRGLEDVSSGLDQRRPLNRRATKFFNGAGESGNARLASYFRWAREDTLMQLYSPAFRAELGVTKAAQPMLDFLDDLPASTGPLEKMLTLEQRFFLADHNLLYTDKMSMAAGVEARVPFLDPDLMDFANSIPIGMKQRGREGKWVLKKAMEPLLPPEVIYRPKAGFGAPLRRWMRHELKGLVSDLLSRPSLASRGLFDPEAVQRLIAANDAGRVDASYTLLALLSIEIWCRTYLKDTGFRQAA
ncbi:MAG: asnB1 [Devosia sp.]|uniref:asparagine synthase (glutamine-hydrolyzing) n=1 Tax=Devosia sp. TaxID=1871048 RepID=UPI002615FD7F|nr:asparagine synthase (glutamine-hydrolyzing) [Devosia sp.]MDB5526957.1 asnB1 [Devosia sp.]